MRAVTVRATTFVVAVSLTAGACTEPPTRATAPTPDAAPSVVRAAERPTRLKDWLGPLWAGGEAAPVLVGAGDIAECYQGSVPPPINGSSNARQSAAEETAKLLDRIPGTVMAVGDNAYQFGSPFDYAACYDPTWGRHFDRTRPAAGNHEYMTPGAAGYFAYFRERAAPPSNPPPGNGYYSYNIGSWHVIVLNSTPQVYLCWAPDASEENLPGFPEIPPPEWPAVVGETCGDGAQKLWLAQDLARHINSLCTVVYFHHPRFSSGHHGNHLQMQGIWRMLYNAGVDVVVTGHDHNYERFAPQNAEGEADPTYGIRQFVVGTGGADLRNVGDRIANSQVAYDDTHGVVALGLRSDRYDWAFIGVDRTVRDSGSWQCHAPPPTPSPPPPLSAQ
jgi:acid phosphatase type 7